jgi:hypothetical protein
MTPSLWIIGSNLTRRRGVIFKSRNLQEDSQIFRDPNVRPLRRQIERNSQIMHFENLKIYK